MRYFIFGFLFMLLCSGYGLRYYGCKIKGLCQEVSTGASEIHFTNKIDDLRIFKEDYKLEYEAKMDSVKKALFDYLNAHQDEELILTGLFTDTEKHVNGLNRVEALKKDLIKYGINKDKIRTNSLFYHFLWDEQNGIAGGILYDYVKVSDRQKSIIEAGITNRVLHSNFGSDGFQPDNTLLRFALELNNYLHNHPGKIVNITGHTDDVGEAESNIQLGLERARSVMEYMVSRGIPAEKIQIKSYGESMPLATNATPEGRQINRRIEIRVINSIQEN